MVRARIACLALLVACTSPPAVDPGAARDSVMELVRFVDQVSAMDALAAYDALSRTTLAYQTMVPAVITSYPPRVESSSATCNADGCSFYVGYAIYPLAASAGGTVVRNGEETSIALRIVSGHGPSLSDYTDIDAKLALTETRLDGVVRLTNLPATRGETVVDYQDVTLDRGCPTGGRLFISTDNEQYGEDEGAEGATGDWPPCASLR